MRDLLKDYQRDWRRWSRAERIAAGLLALFLVVGASAAVLMSSAAHSQPRPEITQLR